MEGTTMDALLLVLLLAGGFLAFDALALLFGTDSRESYGDDHRRSTDGGL